MQAAEWELRSGLGTDTQLLVSIRMAPVDYLYLSEMTAVDLFWKHALFLGLCNDGGTEPLALL